MEAMMAHTHNGTAIYSLHAHLLILLVLHQVC